MPLRCVDKSTFYQHPFDHSIYLPSIKDRDINYSCKMNVDNFILMASQAMLEQRIDEILCNLVCGTSTLSVGYWLWLTLLLFDPVAQSLSTSLFIYNFTNSPIMCIRVEVGEIVNKHGIG